MTPVHLHEVVKRKGRIVLHDLPYDEGQRVEVVVRPESKAKAKRRGLTARDLLKSGLVGLWKDRTDIGDTLEFARKLRKQAETCRSDR